MKHLSKEDLVAIDELAGEISKRGAYSCPRTYELTVCSKTVAVNITKAQCEAHISNNGANFAHNTEVIELQLAGIILKEAKKEAKEHAAFLLVHEATHFLQYKSDCFDENQLKAATQFSCKYDKAMSEENYIAYVCCDVEKPAFAAQLAWEMRETPNLNSENILENSQLCGHIEKRCGNPSDKSNLGKLIGELYNDAKKINEKLSSQTEQA